MDWIIAVLAVLGSIFAKVLIFSWSIALGLMMFNYSAEIFMRFGVSFYRGAIPR